MLADAGATPYRIKLILGHRSMSFTERYLHGSQKSAWAEATPGHGRILTYFLSERLPGQITRLTSFTR